MKTIFALVAVNNPVALGPIIERLFPDDYLLVAPGQWLVADEGTAQSVSEKIGVNGPNPVTTSTVLVLSISGYFGRLNPNVWEWIRAKWGSA
jgi:hypothetical protein